MQRFHSGAAEDSILLGCYAVTLGKQYPTFRKIVMATSSRLGSLNSFLC
jgi:hypothetical protein